MRIAIRDQLGALVLLCTLLALAIVAIASWTNNYSFVYQTRTQRISLVASLKANQFATVLALFETSAKSLTTRIRVQEALVLFNQGNSSDSIWDIPRQDLEGALENNGQYMFAVQCTVTPKNGTTYNSSISLLNTTGTGARIELPYSNGTPIVLGDPVLGYPRRLYPNITLRAGGTPYYADQPLYANSSILLGPLYINSSLSLISTTMPILENGNSSNVLAWMTVVFNASLLMRTIQSREGLGDTGTVLVVGPAERNNRFPGNLTYATFPLEAPDNTLQDTPLRFVWPPDESNYTSKRHVGFATTNATFTFKQYPALLAGLVKRDNSDTTTDLSATNEAGHTVSIGSSIIMTSFATWLLVVELDKGEVWAPINSLRNVLLGCVFGTAIGMLLFIWPLAHFASRPIRRLGEATKHSVEPMPLVGHRRPSPASSTEANPTDFVQARPDGKHGQKRGLLVRLRSLGQAEAVKDAEAVESSRGFRIPPRVKERRALVNDELTDLTTTFNAMSDELYKQYGILEERVRERTEQLEISKQAAEAANESKTLFIANISHELKTPLNGILGMCAVCMQETDPERIRRSLGIIYRSGDLLHNLLTDLLTFSKNEVGRQQLTLDEKMFIAHDITTQLRAIFDTQAAENKIDFQVSFHGPCDRWGNVDETGRGDFGPHEIGLVKNLHLWGDFHRILQVVINLVSNSLKFTPAGGKVNLRIRCGLFKEASSPSLHTSRKSSVNSALPRAQQRLTKTLTVKKRPAESSSNAQGSAHVKQAAQLALEDAYRPPSSLTDSEKLGSPAADAPTVWFEFEVQDTGPGIPKHLQQKIFEPFVQADTRLTKKYGGTGLGLSICSQLAGLMNGTISLESQPGVGSKFVLRIPLKLGPKTVSHQVSETSLQYDPASDEQAARGATSRLRNAAADTPERRNSAHFDSDKNPRLVGLSQPYFTTASPPLASPPSSPAAASKHNSLRVLVAEDNLVNQEVVLRMLRLEDIDDVSVAANGQEAYDMVKKNIDSNEVPFDLILMDIMMPVKDGKSSTRMIRNAGCQTPIVALTAFADDVNQRECLESGMNHFLSKPIRRPALKKVLRTYCTSIQEESEGTAAASLPESKKA